MRKRTVVLLLALVLMFGFSSSASAAKKKSIWVLTSATTSATSDTPVKRTFKYNSRGLFSSITERFGKNEPFVSAYTYNDQDLLTRMVQYKEASPGSIISTETYTYSGKKAIKAVREWPDSTTKYTRNYTWGNGGKKIIIKESFAADETPSETVTLTFDKNKRIKKSVCKYASGGGFTYWYKYDKNGRLTKAYSNSSGKKKLTIKYKYKVNKKGCATKITLVNPATGKAMSVGKYTFKKIKVPSSTYKLVQLQQRSITGWTTEYLELLYY